MPGERYKVEEIYRSFGISKQGYYKKKNNDERRLKKEEKILEAIKIKRHPSTSSVLIFSASSLPVY